MFSGQSSQALVSMTELGGTMRSRGPCLSSSTSWMVSTREATSKCSWPPTGRTLWTRLWWDRAVWIGRLSSAFLTWRWVLLKLLRMVVDDMESRSSLCIFQGRTHIFKIHARSMSVERDIRFELLARLCPNSTGKTKAPLFTLLKLDLTVPWIP